MVEPIHDWGAAYVLGALDADDRALFSAHLSDCAQCRDELAELAPLPALLSRIAPEPVPVDADGDRGGTSDPALEDALQRVYTAQMDLVRSRARWRLGAIAAVLSLVVALSFLAVALPQPPNEPPVEVVDLAGVGAVRLEARGWGTAMELEATGLPTAGSTMTLQALGLNGQQETAASWAPVSAATVRVTGATSIPTDEVTSVLVIASETGAVLASGSR